MSIKNQVFLAGWGLSAKLWQVFHPEILDEQCLDMPCFKDADEEKVIQLLSERLVNAEIIHAWSHSGLWLLRLLQHNKISTKETKKIYCYGLPLLWQFNDKDKKKAFIRQYELNPRALAKKFLKLISFPYATDIKHIELQCLLWDELHYQSQLSYLQWMFSFESGLSLPEALSLCKENNMCIVLAENDAIVNSLALARFFNIDMLKDQSHLSLLSLPFGERK